MAGKMHVVGNAKAAVVVAKIALRIENKKAHDKKVVEVVACMKLQESSEIEIKIEIKIPELYMWIKIHVSHPNRAATRAFPI